MSEGVSPLGSNREILLEERWPPREARARQIHTSLNEAEKHFQLNVKSYLREEFLKHPVGDSSTMTSIQSWLFEHLEAESKGQCKNDSLQVILDNKKIHSTHKNININIHTMCTITFRLKSERERTKAKLGCHAKFPCLQETRESVTVTVGVHILERPKPGV